MILNLIAPNLFGAKNKPKPENKYNYMYLTLSVVTAPNPQYALDGAIRGAYSGFYDY